MMEDIIIAEYTEAIRQGATLPPLIVYFDGVAFWLADGFHRYHAYIAAGVKEVPAEVRTGTKRDAVLYSVGANAAHGLRRTNEDKRRAVKTLLADAEWVTWSDSAIAKACAVGDKTVATHRAAIFGNSEDTPPPRTVTRGGTTYEQNTAKIGKAKGSVERPATDIVPPAPAQSAKKPIPASADTPSDTPKAADAGELAALREENAELKTLLADTLADIEMMGRLFDADDRVKASMAEARRQKALADNAERTLAAKS